MTQDQRNWARVVSLASSLALSKGLKVKRNSLRAGWSVSLPNGAVYHALTESDLVTYIRKY